MSTGSVETLYSCRTDRAGASAPCGWDRIVMLRVSPAQAVNYRLVVNNLSSRLAAGSYVEAAYAGLQDTAPRDALLGLHARVEACEPSAWHHPGLIQTYSP